MDHVTELFLIGVVLVDLFVLGSPSLAGCIRAVAFQGVLLGILPVLLHRGAWSVHTFLIAAGMIGLKGFLIPAMMYKALHEAPLRKEEAALIGFSMSLILGGALVGLGSALARRLPLPPGDVSPLLVPAALSTVMMGILVMVTRAKALSQVLGYLMLENGIFLFGLTLSEGLPELIEMGVFLDVFVAVFLMSTVILHLQTAFGSMNTRNLSSLRE